MARQGGHGASDYGRSAVSKSSFANGDWASTVGTTPTGSKCKTRAARLLPPGAHPVCYSFMEVGQAHNGLYSGKSHVVPDDVAYTRESDSDAPAL
jgi:hypothetical protein